MGEYTRSDKPDSSPCFVFVGKFPKGGGVVDRMQSGCVKERDGKEREDGKRMQDKI